MNTKRLLIIYMMVVATSSLCFSNNLQITNVEFDGTSEVTFDISWDNSWREPGPSPDFFDAVWVFVKVAPNGGAQWLHRAVDLVDAGTFQVSIPPDSLGAIIRRSSSGTGTVSGTVTLDIGSDLGLFPDIKVFGIEMVYVPEGSYYLGDGESPNRWHVGDDTTAAYLVTDSEVMTYGNTSSDIYTESPIISGDIPANYPNGYNAFYSMKYEISQSQYAEFLNCLTFPQQNSRTSTDLSDAGFTNTFVMSNTTALTNRNTIRCIPPGNGDPLFFFCDLDQDSIPNEENDGQNIAMNYLSFDDLKAYLDWCALRPMSPMEYEKACRGPLPPVAGEFAWGTPGLTEPGDIVNDGEVNETFDNIGATGVYGQTPSKLTRCGFAATSTSTRLTSGGSYYGIMELSGNAGENLCTSVLFKEDEYGDGVLTPDGFAEEFENSFTAWGFGTTVLVSTVSRLPSSFATVGTGRSSGRGGRGVR